MRPPAPSFRPSQLPVSESDAPPSAGRYDQEFLYHLYRGSELLQDNSVDEAKAELERALKLQPKDIEGQALLGVVYFRLGLYPRAIEIYEQLQAAAPLEVTPRINLALCYLKTAQVELARAQLEEVIRLAPEHQRAWGYLGLVYQRYGEFDKARVAFERAGRPKLAERMADLAQPETLPGSASQPPNAIAELAPDPSTPSLRPSAFRPSLIPRPQPSLSPPRASVLPALDLQLPLPLNSWSRQAELVFPESPRFVLDASGSVLVRIEASLAVRPAWLGGVSPDRAPLQTRPLVFEHAAPPSDAWLSLDGPGRALLVPRAGTQLCVFDLDRETHVQWRTERLVAFESALTVISGLADPQLGHSESRHVELSGEGSLVAWTRQGAHSLLVSPQRPLSILGDLVLGWFGQLTAVSLSPGRGLPTMLQLSGRGTVLVDPRSDSA